MEINKIDPRTANWETAPAAYRVYFWRRGTAPSHVPSGKVGFVSTEYELRRAEDIAEVIAWANANRQPGQEYAIYATIERDDIGTWLVLLSGSDPTSSRGHAA
jgi:hypothetical protein